MATRREDAVAKEKKSPSRFWAFVSVGVGGLLLLMGFGASAGYLGLPAIIRWQRSSWVLAVAR